MILYALAAQLFHVKDLNELHGDDFVTPVSDYTYCNQCLIQEHFSTVLYTAVYC